MSDHSIVASDHSIVRSLRSAAAVVAAVAVTVAAIVAAPRSADRAVGSAQARVAAIAVELRAVSVQTALAGVAAGQTEPATAPAEPANAPAESATEVASDASMPADPVALISGVANLAVTLAGAALWFAAFPVTLPATMIAGSVGYAIAGYFGCFCFRFPAPEVVVTNGLKVFFEFPAVAVQSAIERLQPVESVAPAALARAAASVSTPSPSDPDAPTPATGTGAGMRPVSSGPSELSASPAGSDVRAAGGQKVEPAQPARTRTSGRIGIATRLASVGPVPPMRASAEGLAPFVSGGTPTATSESVSRSPRGVPAGRR